MNKPNTDNLIVYEKSESRLCDFDKLYSAVLMNDFQAAVEWYTTQYLNSSFAVTTVDSLRSLKNGFIVIVGYMRSAVMNYDKSSATIMSEQNYIGAVEHCNEPDSIFKLYKKAFREFSDKIISQKTNTQAYAKLHSCTDYIIANLNSTLTLSEIAEHCGYNSSYLSRKFKNLFGISISKFILNERLDAAAVVLRCSEKSIAEIATSYKFSSQSHFQQAFKNYFKMTPTQYRKKYREV